MGERATASNPGDFRLGVSAVGYRCEGGFNGPGEPANQWAAWERVGAVAGASASADLWAHPGPWLDRAASTGAQVVTLAVEWARVEPASGRVNLAALDRYRDIMAMASERGLVPMAVLQDIAHPEWLGDELWLTPGAPDRFAEHVGRVVQHLGDQCRHWVPVRQPNFMALAGWVRGERPPRRFGAVSDAWAVLDNLLTAHVLSYSRIHDLQPDPVVALGVRRTSAYDWHRLPVDLLCAPHMGIERDALDTWLIERRKLHDVFTPPHDLADLAARRAHGVLSPFGAVHMRPLAGLGGVGGVGALVGLGGRLPRSCPGRVLDVVYAREPTAPLDALWIGWSNRGRARGVPAWRREGVTSGPTRRGLDPAPLPNATWCMGQHAFTGHVPFWIEDTFVVPASPSGIGAYDRDRTAHVRASIRALAQARASGAPVAGYVYGGLIRGSDPTWPDADDGLFAVLDSGAGSGAATGAAGAAAFRQSAADLGSGALVVPGGGALPKNFP